VREAEDRELVLGAAAEELGGEVAQVRRADARNEPRARSAEQKRLPTVSKRRRRERDALRTGCVSALDDERLEHTPRLLGQFAWRVFPEQQVGADDPLLVLEVDAAARSIVTLESGCWLQRQASPGEPRRAPASLPVASLPLDDHERDSLRVGCVARDLTRGRARPERSRGNGDPR